MEQAFIDEMEAKLKAQRQQIVDALERQREDIREQASEDSGSGDEADVAAGTIDTTLFNALADMDSNQLILIDAALDRIYQGKYGICTKCGKEIPRGRLEFSPVAAMCIQCASEEERRNR